MSTCRITQRGARQYVIGGTARPDTVGVVRTINSWAPGGRTINQGHTCCTKRRVLTYIRHAAIDKRASTAVKTIGRALGPQQRAPEAVNAIRVENYGIGIQVTASQVQEMKSWEPRRMVNRTMVNSREWSTAWITKCQSQANLLQHSMKVLLPFASRISTQHEGLAAICFTYCNTRIVKVWIA